MFDDFTIGPACEDFYLDEYEPDPEPIDALDLGAKPAPKPVELDPNDIIPF